MSRPIEATARSQPPLRRTPFALASVLAVVALVLGARAVVGHLASEMLAAHGLVCAPVTLDPGWTLDSVEIGATSCTVADARVTGVGLPYGASIELGGGLRPRAANIREVTAEIGGEMDLGGVGSALLDGSVPAPMQAALSALAAASGRPDLPAVAIGVARIRRAAVTLALRSISVTREGDTLRFSIAELDLPLLHGRLADLELRVESIEVRATAREVTVDGRFVLDARVARRELDSVVPFHVAGTGLDGPAPAYTLTVEGLDLPAIGDRIDALRARRERGVGEDGGAGAVERIGEIADRLGALRERMAERAGASAGTGAGATAATEGAASPEPGTSTGPAAGP